MYCITMLHLCITNLFKAKDTKKTSLKSHLETLIITGADPKLSEIWV